MSFQHASLRFYVAVTGLLASVFEFFGAFVRLGTALLERTIRDIRQHTVVAHEPGMNRKMALATTVYSVPPAPSTGTVCQVLVATEEQLTCALTGLGFRASNARAFVVSVRGRLAHEPFEHLVREGITALSS